MNLLENSWAKTVLRAAIVTGCGIAVGFTFYQSLIFIPTMKASQFTESSITAGIAYAALKSSKRRNALAALFLWFIVAPLLGGPFHYWLLVLAFVYIVGIGIAIYCYDLLARKSLFDTPIKRILLAAGLVAFANGANIIVLSLILFGWTIAHLNTAWMNILTNLELGVLIGFGVGVGMELADYVIRRISNSESEEVEA
jgi:hypothetical protein